MAYPEDARPSKLMPTGIIRSSAELRERIFTLDAAGILRIKCLRERKENRRTAIRPARPAQHAAMNSASCVLRANKQWPRAICNNNNRHGRTREGSTPEILIFSVCMHGSVNIISSDTESGALISASARFQPAADAPARFVHAFILRRQLAY